MRLYPTPKQAMRIPVAKPSLTHRELNYVMDAWDKEQISGVPTLEYIQRFEQAWSERIGREYVDAVNSGTDALEVVLRALGIGHGDEVLVPAWTFAAPANAVLYVGAQPVLVDIDPENWTIDTYRANNKVTDKTRAIIGVDIFGHPFDWRLEQFWMHGKPIPLIEDAAQAHGASYKAENGWFLCGNGGIASTFSLFANKAITSGEGGVILTNDHELAERISLIRNHGMKANYEHIAVGGNHRMTSNSAAIGLAQMERWDELIEAHNQIGCWYDAYLPAEIGRRPVSDWAQPVVWLYVCTHAERDRLVAGLREQGIDARPTWKSLDQFPIYKDAVRGEYPVARKVASETFVLPTWLGLTEEMVQEICVVLGGLL